MQHNWAALHDWHRLTFVFASRAEVEILCEAECSSESGPGWAWGRQAAERRGFRGGEGVVYLYFNDSTEEPRTPAIEPAQQSNQRISLLPCGSAAMVTRVLGVK